MGLTTRVSASIHSTPQHRRLLLPRTARLTHPSALRAAYATRFADGRGPNADRHPHARRLHRAHGTDIHQLRRFILTDAPRAIPTAVRDEASRTTRTALALTRRLEIL